LLRKLNVKALPLSELERKIKDAIVNIAQRPATETFQAVSAATEFRVYHSPHLEASVCFRYTAPLFEQKRGQAKTESVRVRLHDHGTGGRRFDAYAARGVGLNRFAV
jgi:hypothetical protein